MRLVIGGRDVSELVTRVQTSGSRKEAARTLTAEIIQSATDPNIPVVELALEAEVEFVSDGNTPQKFSGKVFGLSRTTGGSTITVTAQDRGVELTSGEKTVTKKVTGASPSAAAAEFIAAAGFSAGSLASAPGTVARKFVDVDAYDAIMSGYILSGQQNDTSYVLHVDGDTINIEEFGSEVVGHLSEAANLQAATYGEELDYKAGEEDAPGTWTPGQKATVQGLDCPQAVTGKAIEVTEKFTGLTGVFFIDSDVHTWSGATYTNKLTLVFDRMSSATAAGEAI